MANKTATIHVAIEPELKKTLEEIAVAKGDIPVSQLVRIAVRAYAIQALQELSKKAS